MLGYACDHSLHISCNQRIFSTLLRPRRAPTRPRPPLRNSSLSTSRRLIASTHVSTRYRTSNLRRIVDCFCQSALIRVTRMEKNRALLTVRVLDGSEGSARWGSTSHRHPTKVGPLMAAAPNVSRYTCHKHASQSAARGAAGVGTNANRSIHHNE